MRRLKLLFSLCITLSCHIHSTAATEKIRQRAQHFVDKHRRLAADPEEAPKLPFELSNLFVLAPKRPISGYPGDQTKTLPFYMYATDNPSYEFGLNEPGYKFQVFGIKKNHDVIQLSAELESGYQQRLDRFDLLQKQTVDLFAVIFREDGQPIGAVSPIQIQPNTKQALVFQPPFSAEEKTVSWVRSLPRVEKVPVIPGLTFIAVEEGSKVQVNMDRSKLKSGVSVEVRAIWTDSPFGQKPRAKNDFLMRVFPLEQDNGWGNKLRTQTWDLSRFDKAIIFVVHVHDKQKDMYFHTELWDVQENTYSVKYDFEGRAGGKDAKRPSLT